MLWKDHIKLIILVEVIGFRNAGSSLVYNVPDFSAKRDGLGSYRYARRYDQETAKK